MTSGGLYCIEEEGGQRDRLHTRRVSNCLLSSCTYEMPGRPIGGLFEGEGFSCVCVHVQFITEDMRQGGAAVVTIIKTSQACMYLQQRNRQDYTSYRHHTDPHHETSLSLLHVLPNPLSQSFPTLCLTAEGLAFPTPRS
jgi:hypothetical protein